MASLDSYAQPPAAAAATSDFDPDEFREVQQGPADLRERVLALRKELSDWRCRVDAQVRCHRGEVAELQELVTGEMEGLRAELAAMKGRIRQGLAASAGLIGARHGEGGDEAAAAGGGGAAGGRW